MSDANKKSPQIPQLYMKMIGKKLGSNMHRDFLWKVEQLKNQFLTTDAKSEDGSSTEEALTAKDLLNKFNEAASEESAPELATFLEQAEKLNETEKNCQRVLDDIFEKMHSMTQMVNKIIVGCENDDNQKD